ncbi:MAG: hypothetical protein R3E95_10725, partial [Thiolinea sp.]
VNDLLAVGMVYARFRLTSDSLTATQAASAASDGEVEDYAVPIKPYTTPSMEPLSCNTERPWLQSAWSGLNVSSSFGGACNLTFGIACPASSLNNVINISTSDAANVTILLSGTRKVRVSDGAAGALYPAGTYAGFHVERSSLLSATVADSIKINTYKNNALVESKALPSDLIGVSSIIGGGGPQTVGFVSTQDFDAAEIEFSLLLGTSMDYKVYYPVLKQYCAGSGLACNTPTAVNNPAYPVEIDSARTGITGLACVECSVTKTQNAISMDNNDYARINLAASLGVSGSLAIRDVITDYPAGYFAGVEVENQTLLEASLLESLKLETFLDGSLQETRSGGGSLLSLDSALLGSSGRRKVGFATTLPFDEVRVTSTNLLGVFNTTRLWRGI